MLELWPVSNRQVPDSEARIHDECQIIMARATSVRAKIFKPESERCEPMLSCQCPQGQCGKSMVRARCQYHKYTAKGRRASATIEQPELCEARAANYRPKHHAEATKFGNMPQTTLVWLEASHYTAVPYITEPTYTGNMPEPKSRPFRCGRVPHEIREHLVLFEAGYFAFYMRTFGFAYWCA